jgi:hypothetical protein
MNRPNGIAIDQRGYIWVSDTGNGRLQVFDPLGNRLYDFNLPACNVRGKAAPVDIGLLPPNSVYVADALNMWILRLMEPPFNEPGALRTVLPTANERRLLVHSFCSSPNPFNPDIQTAVFRFTLSTRCEVRLLIYDMTGRLIRTIPMDCSEGLNETTWDGCDASGNILRNGVYYLKFVAEAEDESVIKYLKLAVLR